MSRFYLIVGSVALPILGFRVWLALSTWVSSRTAAPWQSYRRRNLPPYFADSSVFSNHVYEKARRNDLRGVAASRKTSLEGRLPLSDICRLGTLLPRHAPW